MKGIRKLFLGLVFLALFGVGFKVDVKAANTDVQLITDNGGTAVWKNGATKIQAMFTTGSDLFPATDGVTYTYEIELNCNDAGTGISFPVFQAERVSATETHLYKDGVEIPSKTFSGVLDSISEGDITTDLGGSPGEVVYDLILKRDGSEIAWSTFTVRAYEVEPEAVLTYSDGTTEDLIASGKVVISPAGPLLLFENETQKFNMTKAPGSGLTFDGWDFGGTPVSNTPEGGKPACTLTASGFTDSNLVANYSENAGADITFTDKELRNAVITHGNIQRKFRFTGGYKASDVATGASRVTIGGIDVPTTIIPTGDGTTGDIRFSIPTTVPLSFDSQDIEIEMKDGRILKVPVYLIDPDAVTFSINPAADQEIEVGDKVVFTPSLLPAVAGATYTYPLDAADKATVSENIAANGVLTVTGASESKLGGAKFEPTVKFRVEGATTDKTLKLPKILVKVTSPTLAFDSNVFANVGLDVALGKFLKNPNTSIDAVDISKSKSYITVNPTKGTASSVIITGSAATKTITDGIKVNNDKTADVTVYPKPTIEGQKVEGSGKDIKYSFSKLTMPKGVYHGDIIIPSLTKAKIEFKGKKDTHTIDIDLTSNDELTMKNKDSFSIAWSNSDESKNLRKILDKICKEDKEEVEVTVYADGDKSVAPSSYKFDVVKVSLDESGGASYEVNGESLSGSFYAVKGLSYNIKSIPKNSNSTLDKWEGVSSGEASASITSSFTDSKTVKATYKSGNATNGDSTNRGGAGGGTGADSDLDPVPETGESKADIWILWSVLLISILGAGFLIWKRFGLARAIAQADMEMAAAQEQERIETEKREEENKMKMLKDLRNL